MAPMSKLRTFNIAELADQLDEPFSMTNIAYVDDLMVSVYVCDGTLQWHRHIDLDELFWVFDNLMMLESERGDVLLGPGELTVVPKGTRHRSKSDGRAIVILLRCGLLPHRKNGKRQLYASGEAGLPHVSLYKAGDTLPGPFQFETVAQVEDSRVQVGRGDGRWPIELPVAHDRMIYVVEGTLTIRTVRDSLRLAEGEFTVVPRGAFYHLHTDEDALLVRVTREVL
jgi:homogentisate 1,2-dioxygenase